MIRNAIVVSISIFVLMSLFPEHAASANASRPPQIPVLEWQPRSDWASVKSLGAVGDGRADDTPAIQKALDGVQNGSVVYLPPGTYRVTKTLTLVGPLTGVLMIGHGQETTLVWDGAVGGNLFADDGVAYSRFVGMRLDGQNKAAVGFHHDSDLRFETEVRHQHMAFINFTDAGILANVSYEGSIVVEGKSPRRDGFLGFLTRLCTLSTHALYLKDNQNIVVSDFYVEQADNGFVFEGDDEDPPGRATIQGAKIHFTVKEGEPEKGTAMKIHNYGGEIFFGHNQFYNEPRPVRIVQQGRNPLTLYLIANCFYNVALNATKEPAAKILLIGNQSAGKVEPEPNDDAPPNALKELSRALDDLRRLGDMDLELNHPDAMPRSRSRRR